MVKLKILKHDFHLNSDVRYCKDENITLSFSEEDLIIKWYAKMEEINNTNGTLKTAALNLTVSNVIQSNETDF